MPELFLKRLFSPQSIRIKLIVIFMAVLILSMTATTLIWMKIYLNRIETERIQQSTAALQETRALLQQYFRQAEKIAQFLAGSKTWSKYLGRQGLKSILGDTQVLWHRPRIEVFDRQGDIVVRESGAPQTGGIVTPGNDALVAAALKLEIVTDYHVSATGLSIRSAVPVVDLKTLLADGAVVVTYHVDASFLQTIKNTVKSDISIQWSPRGDVASTLQDADGNYLTRRPASGLSDFNVLGQIITHRSEVISGSRYAVAYTTLKNNANKDIALLSAVISLDTIEKSKGDARKFLAIGLGITLTLGIILGLLTTFMFTRPVYGLLDAMQRLTRGQLDVRATVMNRNDEFGLLIDAFNKMAATIEDNQIKIVTSSQQLEEMNHRLETFNRNLEKIVSERTADLAATNTRLSREIKERELAARENERLQFQLQQAKKMEAIGTLAGGVAHDLNNILSGLVSYPELLLLDLPPGSPLREPILTIKKSGEKAASIVQDLLTLARRGVTVTEQISLNKIVTEYLRSPEYLELAARHPHVRIETRLDPELMLIKGSSVHLSKTLMNLATNACEAMPSGGSVVIETANRYIDARLNAFENIPEGDYAMLIISDLGIGISPEDMERIFEPFYTKKVMGRSGTGLGMAVVWGTVKDHQGHIDIRSVEGQGTTLNLFFPVSRAKQTTAAGQRTMADFMGHGESLLVVDDIPEQREIASRILQKLNYRVATVSSGEQAVAYLQRDTADLLVLDMIMAPGMDGLDTYRAIVKRHPNQKAIIASGYSENTRVKQAQQLGAGCYVKKPYTLEKLGVAVRKALDEGASPTGQQPAAAAASPATERKTSDSRHDGNRVKC